MAATGSVYTSGDWIVTAGREEEFVKAWTEFVDWAMATVPGARFATLIQQKDDPRHFISFGEWDGEKQVAAWRSHPEFPQKLIAPRSLCEQFVGKDFEVAASIEAT